MAARWRERSIPLWLGLLAVAVAIAQRPGDTTADTKIDLHVDPSGFLSDAASAWTNSGSLGEVQGGQYAGYLFPMGPFFAAGHALGVPDWLVDRLWFGLLLALAAWGTVRLMDALRPGPRGVAHVVAGALMAFNPYTLVYIDRTTVTLLGVAALPWLMLAVHRGLREPRGWWWPGATALLVTVSGPGVNAAVTAWILVGPVALALWEVARGAVTPRALRGFTWRTAVLGLLVSAWWLGPVLVQTLYGIDFLQFTEQPGAIWASTSLSEVVRLMGYWPSYLGVGYGSLKPFYDTTPQLLFDPPVVVASFVVPALAVAGFAAARRWAYGAFFLALLLAGLLIMAAGFPPGTPLREGVTFAYNHLSPIQFLRTSHKAGPLVALSLACLGGTGAGWVAVRLGRSRWRFAVAVAGAALLAVSVLPLTRGRAVDHQLTYDRIPAAWEGVAADLDRTLGPNARALVLPGQQLAFYRWGQTVDAVLPALTDKPVAVRQFVPRADLHSAELLIAVDALVQQERLTPGQLKPLLRLMGVGSVVTGTDDAPGSGAMPAADAARQLAGQGLGVPTAAYGPRREFRGQDGRFTPEVALPEVRRYGLGGARGLVAVVPREHPTLLDGSADGVTALAAMGRLPQGRALEYAGDRSPGAVRAAARAGADLVVSDSNRRRVFVASRPRQNEGATLGASDPISEDAALLDPFPDRGTAAQTVARYPGVRYLRSPFSPQFPQLPERRPYAAFDGSPRTEWLGDTHLQEDRRWVEVGFERRRDIPFVDVLPAGGRRTTVAALEIAGRRYPVRPGWNRLRLGLRAVPSLRLLLRSKGDATDLRLGNGLAEVRIPGLRIRERLRPPTLIESALAGQSLRRSSLTYLFNRTTGDRPYRMDSGRRVVRNSAPGVSEDPEAASTQGATDGETDLSREITPPVPRTYRGSAWASVSPTAPDSRIDRLVGMPTGTRLDSSGRYQGLARYRASGAFDGRPGRAWVADRLGVDTPFLRWTTPEPRRIERLTLRPAAGLPVARPTQVEVRTPSGRSGRVRVGRDGAVRLPRALRARTFRLDVLATTRPPPGRGQGPPTVGIGDVEGAGVPRVRVPTTGPLRGGCDAATLTAGRVRRGFRLDGDVPAVERGDALRASVCGSVPLRSGRSVLRTHEGVVRIDHLALRSPAPVATTSLGAPGRVTDAGRTRRGSHAGVRVQLGRPAWLVLGESFNRGWRATCDGRDLGPPRVIDAYANGWLAPRGCHAVSMRFAPQRAIDVGYVISAVAAALLAMWMLLAVRRGRPRPAAPEGLLRAPAAARRATPVAVVAGAVVAGLASGFLFGLRTGPPAAIAVAAILWRGIGWRPLLAAAVGLLGVVVPAVYVIAAPRDLGGYNSDYAQALVGAHWVVVAVFVALAAVLARSMPFSRARARRGARARGPGA